METRAQKAEQALKILGFIPEVGTGAIYGKRADDLSLVVHTGGGRDKLEVAWTLPSDLWASRAADYKRLSINVSPERSVEAIARDISRRLLPEAERLLTITKERHARLQSEEAEKRACLDRLSNALGVTPGTYDAERYQVTKWDHDRYRVSAKVNSPNSVEIELRYLSPELAARILEFLAGN